MSAHLHLLENRSVLALQGPDTIVLLERLVTNNTANWETGEARYGALLTPQGKVIADFIGQRTDTGILLDVSAAHIAELAKRLKMFRMRSQVEIDPREDLIVVSSTSEQTGLFADPRSGAMPWRGFMPASDYTGDDHYDGVRVSNGIAEQGLDFVSSAIFPSDINMDLLGGVDLKKGCFVGQEVVSRMHRRGNIRKRTIGLIGQGLHSGAALKAEALLGTVTSVSSEHALALVRIDRLAKALADGHALQVDDKPVTLKETDWLRAEMAASLGDD